MAFDRDNLVSLRYWSSEEERKPQRFYVALCLLMSSMQDFFLSLKESEDSNQNWAATCSYYSLVHAGRLLAFLALGDFPKSHSKLRLLMAASHNPRDTAPRLANKYPFDWLQEFQSLNELSPGEKKKSVTDKDYHALRNIVVQYLDDIEVANASMRLERYAKLLSAGANLRNDSNYEALLIAHEYEHRVMTSGFGRLAVSMSKAARTAVLMATDAFNGFLHHDEDVATNRAAYNSFLWEHLHGRIRDAIRNKLSGHEALIRRVDEHINRIHASETRAAHENIEMFTAWGIWGDKSALMRGFVSNLEQLEEITAGE